MPIIPTLGKQRQGDWEFKTILSYIANLRPSLCRMRSYLQTTTTTAFILTTVYCPGTLEEITSVKAWSMANTLLETYFLLSRPPSPWAEASIRSSGYAWGFNSCERQSLRKPWVIQGDDSGDIGGLAEPHCGPLMTETPPMLPYHKDGVGGAPPPQ